MSELFLPIINWVHTNTQFPFKIYHSVTLTFIVMIVVVMEFTSDTHIHVILVQYLLRIWFQ